MVFSFSFHLCRFFLLIYILSCFTSFLLVNAQLPNLPTLGQPNNNNNNNNNIGNNGAIPSNNNGNSFSSNNNNNNSNNNINNKSNIPTDGLMDATNGATTGADIISQAPRFIYPSQLVRFGASDIAVVPAGDPQNPLNVTFDVSYVFIKPKSITLAYARKAFPNVFTNITQLSPSTTKYDWVIPSNFVEAKDYFLRISDTDLLPENIKDGNLRPIYSGVFYVYKRADLSLTPPEVPFSLGYSLQLKGWKSIAELSVLVGMMMYFIA